MLPKIAIFIKGLIIKVRLVREAWMFKLLTRRAAVGMPSALPV